MKVVCICLARINSKRLPGKLMLDLNGKPLIHYTLETMEKLGIESYIFTDSKELKKYAAKNFETINIRNKPEKYCQDEHKTNEELKEYNEEIKADVIIYLAGTSPFRDVERIKTGLEMIGAYDCAMSVKNIPDRMYWFMVNENNVLPLNFKKRTFCNSTTDKVWVFEETGSIYIFKKELLENDFFINEKCYFIYDPVNIDIDTIEDLEKARKYLRSNNGNN